MTVRVAYIARYRHRTMERKIALLAANHELDVLLVRPSEWKDAYGGRALPVDEAAPYATLPVPLLGDDEDPHRALYRTLQFGLGRFRPHVVHTEEEPDSLAAIQIAVARRVTAPRARLVLHTSQNINRPKRPAVRLVTQFSLSEADVVLCVNSDGPQVLREMGYRGTTGVLPREGVDMALFHPPVRRDPGPFIVLYSGRLVPEKGIETLIDAMAELGDDARARIVGAGPHRRILEERALRAGVAPHFQFIGPRSLESLAELYQQADALVLPSRTTPVWKERFGRVLLEAMASGVCVIGSSSGAIPEVIGDAGLVFPEGDAVALAHCLRRVAVDAALRSRLAERGRARVLAQFSLERVAQRTAGFYRWLMSSHERTKQVH